MNEQLLKDVKNEKEEWFLVKRVDTELHVIHKVLFQSSPW
jgi:hypothetical protein